MQGRSSQRASQQDTPYELVFLGVRGCCLACSCRAPLAYPSRATSSSALKSPPYTLRKGAARRPGAPSPALGTMPCPRTCLLLCLDAPLQLKCLFQARNRDKISLRRKEPQVRVPTPSFCQAKSLIRSAVLIFSRFPSRTCVFPMILGRQSKG